MLNMRVEREALERLWCAGCEKGEGARGVGCVSTSIEIE